MKLRGPWSPDQILAFMREMVIPMRLAAIGASGYPCVASLWFCEEAGSIWCATQSSARIVTHLMREPRAGFEIGVQTPPYRGVRGQAYARIHPSRGREMLNRLILRYLQNEPSELPDWLRSRAGTEVAIELVPERLMSWDYLHRHRT